MTVHYQYTRPKGTRRRKSALRGSRYLPCVPHCICICICVHIATRTTDNGRDERTSAKGHGHEVYTEKKEEGEEKGDG